MKFERTEAYMQKLFEQALFDDKNIIKDATVTIQHDHSNWNKLKAYCTETDTYLQFPRALRDNTQQRFHADVIEVIRSDNVTKYYRAMKGSIRKFGEDEVLA